MSYDAFLLTVTKRNHYIPFPIEKSYLVKIPSLSNFYLDFRNSVQLNQMPQIAENAFFSSRPRPAKCNQLFVYPQGLLNDTPPFNQY